MLCGPIIRNPAKWHAGSAGVLAVGGAPAGHMGRRPIVQVSPFRTARGRRQPPIGGGRGCAGGSIFGSSLPDGPTRDVRAASRADILRPMAVRPIDPVPNRPEDDRSGSLNIAKKKPVKTIQLDKNAIDAVIRQLDAAQHDVKTERRKAPRAAMQITACILHLPQAGLGGSPAYLAPTRDISNLGITFLHGAFVYPGTKGIVQLKSGKGHWKNVVVHIVHSTYVMNGLHNTGAHFQAPIEARDFHAGSSTTRILVVEDDPSITALMKHRLAELEAEIQVAPTGEEALQAASSQTFDAVLMDLQLPGIDGFEATRRLRAQGFVGTIVAATGVTDAGVREKCMAAGCNSYLPKPIGQEQLSALLASLRDAPLLSSLRGDILMRPLINEFIADLPMRVQEFEAAYAAADLAKLQSVCRSLKGDAGGYGFGRITEAASAVEKDIIDGSDKEAIKSGFENVVRICCQVRADFGG